MLDSRAPATGTGVDGDGYRWITSWRHWSRVREGFGVGRAALLAALAGVAWYVYARMEIDVE